MSDSESNAIRDAPGADVLLEWFGEWPSFHDANVLSIELNSSRTSCVRIHYWETTSEVDTKGYFVQQKHAVVSFLLENLKKIDLDGFSGQGIIFGLTLTRSEEGFQLDLDPCYGVAGTLTAEKIRIEIQPGAPPSGDLS